MRRLIIQRVHSWIDWKMDGKTINDPMFVLLMHDGCQLPFYFYSVRLSGWSWCGGREGKWLRLLLTFESRARRLTWSKRKIVAIDNFGRGKFNEGHTQKWGWSFVINFKLGFEFLLTFWTLGSCKIGMVEFCFLGPVGFSRRLIGGTIYRLVWDCYVDRIWPLSIGFVTLGRS